MECKDCKYYKKPRYGEAGYGGCKARNLAECPGFQETLRWGFKPRQQDDEYDETDSVMNADNLVLRG